MGEKERRHLDNTYLPEGPFPLVQFVEHVDGDEGERGYSQEPANTICPPWIHICVIKFQGTVLD